MRRMYSEQELTIIIHDVVGDYIEEGAFDESIASAVDAYLQENPVDITALEGKDVELNSLDADGLITGGEIVEKMSGYSVTKLTKENITHNIVYAGAVKNGNKLTITLFEKVTRTGDVSGGYFETCRFFIPKKIYDAIIPTPLGAVTEAVSSKNLDLFSTPLASISLPSIVVRYVSGNTYALVPYIYNVQNMVLNQEYQYRIELTFLLSENLASE